MKMTTAFQFAVVCAVMLLPGAAVAGGKQDGSWITHLACEAHGENPCIQTGIP